MKLRVAGKKFVLSILVFTVLPLVGLFAADHYGVFPVRHYLNGLRHPKLKILTGYRRTMEENRSTTMDPELLAAIEAGLQNEAIRTCFQAPREGRMDDQDNETIAFCKEHQVELDRLAELFNTLPRGVEIPCDFETPHVFDGCQGELCGRRIGTRLVSDTQLLPEIPLNGIGSSSPLRSL